MKTILRIYTLLCALMLPSMTWADTEPVEEKVGFTFGFGSLTDIVGTTWKWNQPVGITPPDGSTVGSVTGLVEEGGVWMLNAAEATAPLALGVTFTAPATSVQYASEDITTSIVFSPTGKFSSIVVYLGDSQEGIVPTGSTLTGITAGTGVTISAASGYQFFGTPVVGTKAMTKTTRGYTFTAGTDESYTVSYMLQRDLSYVDAERGLLTGTTMNGLALSTTEPLALEYTDKAITPQLVVSDLMPADAPAVLSGETDYMWVMTDAGSNAKTSITGPGQYTITVTGKGDYAGQCQYVINVTQAYSVTVAAGEWATAVFSRNTQLREEDRSKVGVYGISDVTAAGIVLTDNLNDKPYKGGSGQEADCLLIHNPAAGGSAVTVYFTTAAGEVAHAYSMPGGEGIFTLYANANPDQKDSVEPESDPALAGKDCYVCNGKEFVRMERDGIKPLQLAANRWLLCILKDSGYASTWVSFVSDTPSTEQFLLTEGSNPDNATVTFKVNNKIVTQAAENSTVTVTVTAAAGTSFSTIRAWAYTYINNARAPRRAGTTGVLQEIALTKQASNRYSFTMPRAHVAVDVVCKKALQDTWLQPIPNQTYTGAAVKPKLAIQDGDYTLVEGTDYTVKYSNNTNPGNATVTVTAKGERYSGSITGSFTIDKAPMSNTRVELNESSFVYDGKIPQPVPTVWFNGKKLKEGTDYTYYSPSQSNAGTYNVTVRAAESSLYFEGEVKVPYTISQAPCTLEFEVETVIKEYGDEPFTNLATVISTGNPRPGYDSSNENVATVNVSTGKVTIHNTGTAIISATVKPTGNYQYGYDQYTLVVNPKTVESDHGTKVTLDEKGYHYTIDETSVTGGVVDATLPKGDLTYSRILTVGGHEPVWSGDEQRYLFTACLPFYPVIASVKFYTLSDVSDNWLVFEEVAQPEKYTPYLLSVTKDASVRHTSDYNPYAYVTPDYDPGTPATKEENYVVSMDFDAAVNNSPVVKGFQLCGTLRGLSAADAVGTYILQKNGKWGYVTGENTGSFIPPFRAYLRSASQGAPFMESGFGSTTGIRGIATVDADGTERWYDLNGNRIDKPTRKGVYIHNGRKEVVK